MRPEIVNRPATAEGRRNYIARLHRFPANKYDPYTVLPVISVPVSARLERSGSSLTTTLYDVRFPASVKHRDLAGEEMRWFFRPSERHQSDNRSKIIDANVGAEDVGAEDVDVSVS